MAEVHFTSWLREVAPKGPAQAAGATVGEALADLFVAQPQVRGYLLDDQGRLRKHVCIFVVVAVSMALAAGGLGHRGTAGSWGQAAGGDGAAPCGSRVAAQAPIARPRARTRLIGVNGGRPS